MRWLIPILACCATALVAMVGVLIWLGDDASAAPSAPDYSYATIGGVQYHALQGNVIDPSSSADARFVRGMPASERRLPKGEVLFGVFVSRANSTDAALPTASRIDLTNGGVGRADRPLGLSATNPYTYSPGTIGAGRQLPASNTRAANDIAAGGQLLLYGVPAWQVDNGWLELAVHDPLHPGAVGYVQL